MNYYRPDITIMADKRPSWHFFQTFFFFNYGYYSPTKLLKLLQGFQTVFSKVPEIGCSRTDLRVFIFPVAV